MYFQVTVTEHNTDGQLNPLTYQAVDNANDASSLDPAARIDSKSHFIVTL